MRLAATLVVVVLAVWCSVGHGEHLEVFMADVSPFFLPAEVPYGYYVDLWEEIANQLALSHPNLTYTIHQTPLANVLTNTSSYTFGVGLAPLAPKPDQWVDIDFTVQYFASGLDVLTYTTVADQSLFQIFLPFDYIVWILIVVCVYVSGVLIWFLERSYNPVDFPRGIISGINEGVWYCWGLLTGVNQKALKGLPSRLFGGAYALFAIIVVGAYTANFTLILLLPPATVSTVTGNTGLSGYKIGTVHGGTGEDYLLNVVPSARLYSYGSIDECLAKLKAGTIDAILHDRPILIYQQSVVDLRGEMQLLGLSLTADDYAIALPKDSPFVEDINLVLSRILDNGVESTIYKRWFNQVDVNSLHQAVQPQFTILNAVGIYTVLLISLAAGVASYVWFRFFNCC